MCHGNPLTYNGTCMRDAKSPRYQACIICFSPPMPRCKCTPNLLTRWLNRTSCGAHILSPDHDGVSKITSTGFSAGFTPPKMNIAVPPPLQAAWAKRPLGGGVTCGVVHAPDRTWYRCKSPATVVLLQWTDAYRGPCVVMDRRLSRIVFCAIFKNARHQRGPGTQII